MFRQDKDFHDLLMDYVNMNNARWAGRIPGQLVGGVPVVHAVREAVVDKGVPVTWMRLDMNQEGYTDKRRSPVIFYSDPSMALIAHADAITGEITPGGEDARGLEASRGRRGRSSDRWTSPRRSATRSA